MLFSARAPAKKKKYTRINLYNAAARWIDDLLTINANIC